MESLLARYFDGELNEQEARELLEACERNPDLDGELRTYERVIAMAKALPTPRVPADFTARVMADIGPGAERRAASFSVGDRVARGTKRSRVAILPASARARWVGVALAAGLALVAFVGGFWTGRGRAPVGGEDVRVASEAPGRVGVSSTALPASTAGTGFRYVRLVYVPRGVGVERVTVAGSFNGWNPGATPLRREDGVWSTILVLPPGSYEYMFVEDGERWVTDPLAAETRDDGFGTRNAVLDVEL